MHILEPWNPLKWLSKPLLHLPSPPLCFSCYFNILRRVWSQSHLKKKYHHKKTQQQWTGCLLQQWKNYQLHSISYAKQRKKPKYAYRLLVKALSKEGKVCVLSLCRQNRNGSSVYGSAQTTKPQFCENQLLTLFFSFRWKIFGEFQPNLQLGWVWPDCLVFGKHSIFRKSLLRILFSIQNFLIW